MFVKTVGRLFMGLALTAFITFLVYFINPWVGAASSIAFFATYWAFTKPVNRGGYG